MMNVIAVVFAVLSPSASADDGGLSACLGGCADFAEACMKDAEAQAQEDCSPLPSSTADGVRRSCEAQGAARYAGTCAEATGTCHDSCAEAAGGGAGAGYVVDGCPSGTRPSPLGTCMPDFGAAEADLDLDREDGCPAGFERGGDDGCVPAIDMVPADVVGRADGSGFVVCPGGTVPGPVGGCVFDTASVAVDEVECPPGFVGGDGQCVPDHSDPAGRMVLGAMVRAVAAVGVELPASALAAWGVVAVDDVEVAVDELEESWGW